MTYLICGLGNPGDKYQNTPHNVGFMVIDQLAKDYNINLQIKFTAGVGSGLVNSEKTFLVKPLSYMNLSGTPLNQVRQYYSIEPENIIVVHDDIDIEFGKIKLKLGGSDGGHNGLKSISGALKTPNYYRIRLGVGRSGGDAAKHVLSNISGDNLKELPFLINNGVDAVLDLMKDGLETAQRKWHAVSINK